MRFTAHFCQVVQYNSDFSAQAGAPRIPHQRLAKETLPHGSEVPTTLCTTAADLRGSPPLTQEVRT